MGEKLTEEEKRARAASADRILIACICLISIFVLIFLDGMGFINIEKWGYGALGAWITLIIQFYFRKAGK